ncbi:hypothetical protein ASG43_08270 [Aureimonas sp. Leaf454]|uniref:hypothetical protein n=1 Tax=Aureimonas sp. Leaf454 TaxID=1736381 RepID=UPI0006F1CD20|nr:hypothetical protein [Aureimonas sp. Leaf454]KQT48829.1 hypothetical protein ASG43_08270 [Aureimonas sp. Leaf454]
MKRLATSTAAAAWMGFLGVFAAELLLDASLSGGLAASASGRWPVWIASHFDGLGPMLEPLNGSFQPLLALVCATLAIVFASGLHVIHRSRAADPGRAETLIGGGLAGVAILAVAARASGLPILPVEPGSSLVWVALALSAVALLFDRLVDTGDAQDDREFEASVSAIADSLARQTRLYTPSHTRSGHGRR